MTRRPLGSSALHIAPLVFGGNVFGWTVDERTSHSLLDAMVDLGIDMVDTADCYSVWAEGHRGGESEIIIGKWLKASGRRDRVILATKVGMPMGDGSQGLARDNILRSAEASLKRLGVERIDVYYAHQDDPRVPLEETLSAFQTLIEQGKVGAIASSNYSAERLAAALACADANGLPRFVAHQPEYNLIDRAGYEGALESVCRAQGLGVVTYFSLASGYLSGKYRSNDDLVGSRRGAGFLRRYLTPRGDGVLSALAAVAERHATSMATVALAWIIQRPGITAPIASATSVQQLRQLADAMRLRLSEADIAALDEAGRE